MSALKETIRKRSIMMRERPTKLKRAILRDGVNFEKIVPWAPLRQEKESTLLPKVTYIPAHSNMTNEMLTLTWIKKTWAGRFYNSVSIKNQFVRNTVSKIWRSLFILFCRTYSICLNGYEIHKWHPIVTQKIYAQREMIVIHKLLDSSTVKTPAPKVYPLQDQAYLRSPHDQYQFPEVGVSIINNAIVNGGSNLILVNGAIICHDLYDFDRDYTSEELNKRTLISSKSGLIKWLVHDATPEKIAAAGVFVDALAPNYAHWLTEVLPRIAAFCADERFKRIPIVVNADLHPNIMSSMYTVTGDEREVILLPVGRALIVKELFLTTATGYVPFGRRTNKLSDHSHGVFSSEALANLVNKLKSSIISRDSGGLPDKIYIRRNGQIRAVLNQDEIEDYLQKEGYAIVEPEKLSFNEQMILFSNARLIVSPTGAALANCIFSRPNTLVIVLMPTHHEMIYYYWNNMLSSLGVKTACVLGEMVKNCGRGIHGDYFINVSHINRVIKELTGP